MKLLAFEADALKNLSQNVLGALDTVFPRTMDSEHRLSNFVTRTATRPVPQTGGRDDCFWKARRVKVPGSHNFFVGEAARLKADYARAGR